MTEIDDLLPSMRTSPHDAFIASLAGGRIGGRYVLDEVLGRGGMGLVARARHPELDQAVAIKFMWPELAANDMLAKRFLREARVAAKVQSPHLVRVFDVGHHDGVPYMVMEMLNGRDLGSELRERGPLPIVDAVEWVLQAMVGVAEIHASGIVHRDLKPTNLFLAGGGGTRTVKVLDFGISKEIVRTGASLTSTEQVLGTPQYMSPEQIKAAKHVDARSDIWALGTILYELLTGALPFVGESDGIGELFGLILFASPRSPRDVRPELPTDLENLILRCLSREPRERFTTVGELADALRPWVASGSVHRIDAIHRALSVGPTVPPPGTTGSSAIATVPAGRAISPAAESLAEPPVSGGMPGSRPVDEPSPAASSIVTAATVDVRPSYRSRPPRRAPLYAALSGVGFIVVLGTAVAVTRVRATANGTTTTSSSNAESSTDAQGTAPSHAPLPASATSLPSVSEDGGAPTNEPTIKAAVPVAPVRASGNVANLKPPAASPSPSSSAPPAASKPSNPTAAASSSSAAPSTDILLLDRK